MEKHEKIHALDINENKIDSLDEDLNKYFNICIEKIGFIPNVLRSYSWNQKKLRTFAKFYNEIMLGESKLSILEREMIALVVSSSNNCYYCQVAHGAAVRTNSKDSILSEILSMNYKSGNFSQRHYAMLEFSYKLSITPDLIKEDDRELLRNNGFSDEEIWDICEVVGFFNMTNRIASGIEMVPNEEYHFQGR
ncbi:MAG: alkylhydroperoxidase [Rhodospirillaceae bacterium]|nr:alkylhydroperoxidase [Rhodospirillaceae bacterium]